MKSYILRIYRGCESPGELLAGTIEEVDGPTKSSFAGFEGLRSFLESDFLQETMDSKGRLPINVSDGRKRGGDKFLVSGTDSETAGTDSETDRDAQKPNEHAKEDGK